LGGNNLADIQRLTIVADPANANGSAFGGIRAGNAVFGSSSGVAGISAANVAVQNVVVIGDIDATQSAIPTLNFGSNSQFGAVTVAGGDLTNSKTINNSGYNYNVVLGAGTTSGGGFLVPQATTPTFTQVPSSISTATQTIANGTELYLVNNTTGATFTFEDTTGTADTATLNLNKVSTGAANVTIAGVETITVNSNGADANDITPNFAAAKTLIVGGATELTLTGTNTVATSITSTNTAGVTVTSGLASIIANTTAGGVTIAGGAGHDTITVSGPAGANESISGGDGNDTIIFATGLTNTDSISGGAGTDTFASTSALLNAYAAPTAATLSGFETLRVTNALANAVNTSKIQAGLTTVDLAAGSNGGSLEVDAGSNTVQIGAANAGTLTIQTASTNTSTTDAVTINNTAAATNVFNGQGLTVSRIETVTINGSGTGAATAQSIGALNAGTAVVNLTGSNSFTISGTTTATELNAGGLTGTASLTMGASAATAVTRITGTANADTIRDGAGSAVISGGAGNDSIFGGAGNDNISGGEGDDTFTMGTNLSSADTIDGGAGNDRLLVTGLVDGALTNVTNVETLAIGGATVTAGTLATAVSFATIDMDNGDATTTQNVTLATGFSGSPTFLVNGGDSLTNNTSAAITVRATDANLATITVAGGAGVDTLEITPTINGIVDVNLANRVTGVETINVLDAGDTYLSAGFDAQITTGNYASTATVATTLTINASGLDAESTPLDANGVDTTTRSAETLTVDASAIASPLVRVSVTGGSGADTLTGGSGNDVLIGGAGNDRLSGGAGNNTLVGDAGNDTIVAGSGIDSIQGGDGSDRIILGSTLTGLDTIDGGTGTDTLEVTTLQDSDLANTSNIEAVILSGAGTLSFAAQRAGITTVTTHTTAAAVSAADYTTGVTVNVRGGAGQDQTLTGGSGNDTFVFGGNFLASAGSFDGDTLTAADVIAGGLGTDTVTVRNSSASSYAVGIDFDNVTGVENINLGTASGTDASGSTVSDTITLTIADLNNVTTQAISISASAITSSSDRLVVEYVTPNGSALSNTSFSITGGAGNDILLGALNNDTIIGGSGADIIDGQGGADQLTGGTGNDTFVITGSTGAARDTIIDFSSGDRLQIAVTPGNSVFDATYKGAVTNAGDAAANFTGTAGAPRPGQYVFNTANSSLLLDTDGTGLITGSDQQVVLAGVTSFDGSALDFVVTASATGTTSNITTGGGNDRFTLGSDLTSLDLINGGAGNDTLSFTDANSATTDIDGVSNVEVISLGAAPTAFNTVNTNVAAGATLTITGAGMSTHSTAISAAAETDGNVSISITSTTGTVSLVGGDGNDTLTANTASGTAITLTGGGGNDTLVVTSTTVDSVTTSGVATLTGGTGIDTITGGVNNDTIVYLLQADLVTNGAVIDSVNGGAGTDIIQIGTNGTAFSIAASDSFARMSNVETISAVANNAAVSITLGASAETAGIRSVTMANASAASGNVIDVSRFSVNTTLTGGSGATSITGGSGRDSIVGGAGIDTLNGGAGNDTITGADAADSLVGGDGDDTFVYLLQADLFAGTPGAIVDATINGGAGTDELLVGTSGTSFTIASTDVWSKVSSIETIRAVANSMNVSIDLADTARTAGINRIDLSSDTDASGSNLASFANYTGTGSVTLLGGAGVDALVGGRGADSITGGAGNDNLTGQLGADTVTGGTGRDVFVVASDKAVGGVSHSPAATTGFDTITDFRLAEASWTAAAGLDEVTEVQASANAGGASLDILDIQLADTGGTAATLSVEGNSASSVSTTVGSLAETVKTAIGATGTVTTAVTDGLLTVSSTVATDIDSLAKWLNAAAAVAATDGETLAFVFDGSTYVFTQNGSQDLLVKLDGITNATGVTLITAGSTALTGAAGRIVIG